MKKSEANNINKKNFINDFTTSYNIALDINVGTPLDKEIIVLAEAVWGKYEEVMNNTIQKKRKEINLMVKRKPTQKDYQSKNAIRKFFSAPLSAKDYDSKVTEINQLMDEKSQELENAIVDIVGKYQFENKKT